MVLSTKYLGFVAEIFEPFYFSFRVEGLRGTNAVVLRAKTVKMTSLHIGLLWACSDGWLL